MSEYQDWDANAALGDPADLDFVGSGADNHGSPYGFGSDGIDLNSPEGLENLEERRLREAGDIE